MKLDRDPSRIIVPVSLGVMKVTGIKILGPEVKQNGYCSVLILSGNMATRSFECALSVGGLPVWDGLFYRQHIKSLWQGLRGSIHIMGWLLPEIASRCVLHQQFGAADGHGERSAAMRHY